MKEITKKYSNGEITVVWKPHVCMHSGICFRGLPQVFDPRVRPWIKIEGASTQNIAEQVKKCPSGALSYTLNKESMESKEKEAVTKDVKIQISANGPLLVEGTCQIIDKNGKEEIKNGKFALCRCGQSKKKPYCDGSHKTIIFDN